MRKVKLRMFICVRQAVEGKGEMMQQVMSIKTVDSRGRNKIGGMAALVTGVLLLLGMTSLIDSLLQPGNTDGWLLLFQNNWLVKIFKLHAEFRCIQADLYGMNLLDMVVLLFVSILCLGLSTTFRRVGKTWSMIAFALSLIAILLFSITLSAGRSTVMLAVLINSLVMFGEKTISRVTIYVGILASVLLFVGDLTVGIHSDMITTLFGLGYVLLILWFFLIAGHLFRPGRGS